MAVPKRKTSKARRDKRRASNIKMVAPAIVECPSCHEPKVVHRVCPNCGEYKGREIIAVEE
jgi:large subunit ribosomal protein L32